MAATIEQHLSTGQAARRMQRSKQRVHQLIAAGRLPTVHTVRGHLISPDDVDAIIAAREPNSNTVATSATAR